MKVLRSPKARLACSTRVVLCCSTVVVILLIIYCTRQRRFIQQLRANITGAHRFTNLREYSVSLELLSKIIVIRRAYFDDRKRNDHKNAVVFMLEMKRSVQPKSLFAGCRVGSVVSSKVHFRHSEQYNWAISNIHVTKNVAFVDCFDVFDVKDGDPAYLTIGLFKIGSLQVKDVEVRSQRNVVVPQSRKYTNPHPSVVACVATIRMGEISPSDDGLLYQWLRYQKTIGVDHVHIVAEDTFSASGGFRHPVIQDALKANYLSIDFWPRWFNTTEIYHSSQHLAYTDCLYRFQGAYDYGVFSDLDDFFVPRGKSKSIKTYLQRWCSGKILSCMFKWYEYYPDCGWSPESVDPDGNLTATVHTQKSVLKKNPKSAHQLQGVVEIGIHYPMVNQPGYKRPVSVPFREAYFAHLRKQILPPGGCSQFDTKRHNVMH